MPTVMTTVLIAVVSSLVTALVFGLVARWWIRRRMASASDEIAVKVRDAVEEGAEAAIPRVREAVRSGLTESIDENLPRVREAVRDGVEEAIASAVTGGVVEKAGEELARKGTSVLNRILRGSDER